MEAGMVLNVLSYVRPRQARELSVLLRWKRILVFGGLEVLPHMRDSVTGRIRPVEADDKVEGRVPSDLDFMSCFWKLHLSAGPHLPLNTVFNFLAYSPLN